MSVVDSLFRNLILTSQFVKGWGQPSHLKRLMGGRVEQAFHFQIQALNLLTCTFYRYYVPVLVYIIRK